MKKTYILGMMIAATVVTATGTSAQVTATAGASVNVITPISITKNFNMNFGNAAVSSVSGGTIVLSPSGARSAGGSGVTLPATNGSVAAAVFTVAGAPGYTYSISLPGSTIIYGPGTATMSVNGFSSLPSGVGTLNTGGLQTLNVGATLSVAAAQAPGSYTNLGAIPVTVNYN